MKTEFVYHSVGGSPNGLSLNKDIWDIFVDCKIVKENPNNNNNGGNSGLSLIRIFFVQCWRGRGTISIIYNIG